MSEQVTMGFRGQARVLIADDDPVLRSLVCANLVRRAAAVVEASDGRQAWDLLLNQAFEIALIDLSMPNIDGFTLIQCMRAHPRTKHMPIVVITSSDDKHSIERAFEVGATSFLTKPINWSLFAHHIDYLIRLSENSNLARSTMHHAEAIARAKDAVIVLLAARVREHAGRITSAARSEARLLEMEAGESSAADMARAVLTDAAAIVDALDSTLPFLHGIAEQIVVDDKPIMLDLILRAAIGTVQDVATASQVEVLVEKPVPRAVIRCDDVAIVRALSNVLRNAVQHSEPGGLVKLAIEHRNDNVLAVSVSDNGRGADPDLIAQCLRPLDGLSHSGESKVIRTGLGLPIAKGIVQAHGGLLEISTAPGMGATVVLVFPADIVEVRHDLVP